MQEHNYIGGCSFVVLLCLFWGMVGFTIGHGIGTLNEQNRPKDCKHCGRSNCEPLDSDRHR